MNRWLTGMIGFLLLVFPLPARGDAGGGGERLLVICVDGVPFEDFQALQEEGLFPYLKGRAKLISPFPSLTNPAMAEILGPGGAPVASGFEDRYYCWDESRMCGGLSKRFSTAFVEESFRRMFEFHPPGYLSGFEYLLPPFSCVGAGWLDLGRALGSFRRSAKPVFEAYLGPTDCAAHTGGRRALRLLLKRLDQELAGLLNQYPLTRLVLYSDHGNDYVRYRRVGIAGWLERNGFRVESRIRNERSVVFPRFGLVGVGILHAAPSSALVLAELVSRLEGVHFASVKKKDEVILFRKGKKSWIRREGDRLFYVPGREDPLELGETAGHDRQGWFETTSKHVFPDAVNRVWQHSEETVENRASVIVDLERGYYAGSQALDLFVALKATHGSLAAEQSLGFLATTEARLPEVISSREAWKYLRPQPW